MAINNVGQVYKWVIQILVVMIMALMGILWNGTMGRLDNLESIVTELKEYHNASSKDLSEMEWRLRRTERQLERLLD